MKVYIVISQEDIPYESPTPEIHSVWPSLAQAKNICYNIAPSVYDGNWTVMKDGSYSHFDNTKFLMQANTENEEYAHDFSIYVREYDLDESETDLL